MLRCVVLVIMTYRKVAFHLQGANSLRIVLISAAGPGNSKKAVRSYSRSVSSRMVVFSLSGSSNPRRVHYCLVLNTDTIRALETPEIFFRHNLTPQKTLPLLHVCVPCSHLPLHSASTYLFVSQLRDPPFHQSSMLLPV